MIVRPLRDADLAAVAAIQAESPEASQWAVNECRDALCLVAERNDTVLGFVLARQLVPGEAEILNLAVSLTYRREGAGRYLVEHLKTVLDGEIFLEVRASNQHAIAFYKSLGFEHAGSRVSYYQNPGEDAIVLRFQPC